MATLSANKTGKAWKSIFLYECQCSGYVLLTVCVCLFWLYDPLNQLGIIFCLNGYCLLLTTIYFAVWRNRLIYFSCLFQLISKFCSWLMSGNGFHHQPYWSLSQQRAVWLLKSLTHLNLIDSELPEYEYWATFTNIFPRIFFKKRSSGPI